MIMQSSTVKFHIYIFLSFYYPLACAISTVRTLNLKTKSNSFLVSICRWTGKSPIKGRIARIV